MAPHMRALQALTEIARLVRQPFCSYNHRAIVRFALSKVDRVNSDGWSALPLPCSATNVRG